MSKLNIIKQISLIFIGLLIPLFATAEYLELAIKVDNPTDEFVSFSYKKTATATDASVFRMDLNSTNEARFELYLEESKFIDMLYGDKVIPLYIELEDQLQISFDGNDIHNTLKFEGEGAVNNNFLASYRKQFRSPSQYIYDASYLKVKIDEDVKNMASLEAGEVASTINASQAKQMDFLLQYQSEINLFLLDYIAKEITYTNATNKVAWFLENQSMMSSTGLSAANEQMDVVENIELDNEAAAEHPAYQNFLRAYALYLFLPKDLERFKIHFTIYSTVDEKLTGRAKYFIQKELLVRVYERSGDPTIGFKHFGDFSKNNPYPEYTENVLTWYDGQLSGTENVDAPDFDMADPKGILISLSDFKGQVVYISYWASWCKPCIEGFEKSAETRKKLKDMGVILLNVSIDKTEEAWKEAMIKHNPEGINGLVLSLEDITKKYNLSTIPQYYIVDKHGKFAYLSQTGNRNILDEFRQLVSR